MGTARFDSAHPHGEGWHARLEQPVETLVATRLEDVVAVLARADEATRAGLWAAVAVSYDAAAAFEPAMPHRRGRTDEPFFPLIWAALFERSATQRSDRLERSDRSEGSDRRAPSWSPTVDPVTFAASVRTVQEHIRAGDTYQANLTFPMRAESVPGIGDPGSAIRYDTLLQAQAAKYCAHLDLGTHEVLSLSPELFFERRGERLLTRPMKGTTGRGRWHAEDEARARALAASPKDRAENVMIVDLLRNDVGRVARPGTVRVPALFRLERYPTLWQMTSDVEGEVPRDASLVDLFTALFPCGSVTGAPKIRTMHIIDHLEREPRGLYTGTIGLVEPGGDCTFSVAIRTIVIDRRSGMATMGVGAGITADSVPEDEYAECLLKAAFAGAVRLKPETTYDLLETMRLEDGAIVRLERHLARMEASAQYFGFTWNPTRVRDAVDAARRAHGSGCWRLRLVVDSCGTPDVACTPHEPGVSPGRRVAFAGRPVDSRDPFLFNKTTNRAVYDSALSERPDVDDVLLVNEHGEVTESTSANLVAEIDGVRVTPPVSCGLLGGTLRAELVEAGAVQERPLTREDVRAASRLWLINSLRGWIDASLVD